MSRRSSKTEDKNNLKTSSVRFENKCSARVFDIGTVTSVTETVLLYKLVFMSRKAVLLSLLLCVCFLSQPFQNVYADEVEPVAQPEVPQPPKVTIVAEAPEVSFVEESPPPAADISPPEEGEVKTSDTANDSSSVLAVSDNAVDSDEIIESAVIEEDEDLSADSSQSSSTVTTVGNVSASSSEAIASSTAATSTGQSAQNGGGSASEDEVPANDNSSDEDDVDASGEEDAIVSVSSDSGTGHDADSGAEEDLEDSQDVLLEDEETEALNDGEFVSVVESDSSFTFNENECTRIEDGSFYCQKSSGELPLNDSLVALPDGDGDLEIFLVRDGMQTQITHNKVDDASPFYDEYSRTIVWHRLVDDRYQIISYDIETGDEVQITDGFVNNMEPTRHGDYIVWQRWVQNNWEVILYNSGTERQITDSPRHDIAPHVRGPLVIWNSRSNDGTQSLKTYDIQNRTYTTIEDGDGVSVSNPRMVVMYEAMYENGDVVMKGFDLVSGKIVPLQSIPRQLPDELPETDSTGETRALIQSKPSPKGSDVTNSSSTPPTDGNASSTPEVVGVDAPSTLDLRATSTPDISEIITPDIVATSTIPDLVILPIEPDPESATSSQTAQE